MSTTTLPNIRVSSDLTVRVRLKDGGVAIDWTTLNNIKAHIYSDAQRALAGRCDVSVDAEDPTLLVCNYAANKPQYVGVNRIVVSAKYMGETKTYDKPAFNFVRWTADQEGEEITIDDPDVDVEIEVEDVTSSILQEAIDAALQAAADAEHAAHLVPLEVLQDCEQATADALDAAASANAAGIDEVQATVDAQVGTPSVDVDLENKVLSLDFHNMKGETGEAAGFGTASASLTEDGGDPGVTVSASGPDTAKQFAFTFKNLKGDKGDKGDQGNTGSSVDYPYELVNNCTTNDATKGLAASQGVALAGEVSQLEAKVNNYQKGAYLNNSGAQVSDSGWGFSDYVPYHGGTVNYKWDDSFTNYNGICIIFYNSSKTVIDYYSCANGSAANDGRTLSVGDIAAGTAFVRLSFVLGTSAHIKIAGETVWTPKSIKERVETLEGQVVDINGDIAELDNKLGDSPYKDSSIVYNWTAGIINADGTITNGSADYRYSALIPVTGDKIQIRVYSPNSTTKAFAFYAQDESVVDVTETGYTKGNTNVVLVSIPSGAYYIRLQTNVTELTEDLAGVYLNPYLTNKATVEKFSESSGNLLWDGEPVVTSGEVTIETISNNIADPSGIEDGKLVANDGTLYDNADWSIYKLPVTPGEVLTVAGFYLGRSGYYAFYNGSSLVSFSIFADPNGTESPLHLTAPAGANLLYIDIKSGDSPSNPYQYFQINNNAELLPYDEFREVVTEILGKDLVSSGCGSNPDIIMDLPVGDGTGISVGYAYIDSATGNVKVKLS